MFRCLFNPTNKNVRLTENQSIEEKESQIYKQNTTETTEKHDDINDQKK